MSIGLFPLRQVGGLLSDVRDRTGSLADQTRSQAGALLEEARQRAEDLVGQARDRAADVVDLARSRTGDVVDDAWQRAGELMSGAGGWTAEVIGEARQVAGGLAASAGDLVSEIAAQARLEGPDQPGNPGQGSFRVEAPAESWQTEADAQSPSSAGTSDEVEARHGEDADRWAVALQRLWEIAQGRSRHVWVSRERAHIQVSSGVCADAATLKERIESELREVPGVRWVSVNPALCRVVISFEQDAVALERLVGLVDEIDPGWAAGLGEPDAPEHPADIAPLLRELLCLGVDAVSLVLGTIGRLAHLPAVPAQITSVVPIVANAPPLRRMVETRLGAAFTELGLTVLDAASQAVGQGRLGPAVDLVHRASIVAEMLARRSAWTEREPQLCGAPEQPWPTVEVRGRRNDLPQGPIERYAERAWLASLAAAGVTIPLTRSLERGSAALSAGLPKAARLGREAFAAHLGRVLAQRGILVLNPRVLRLLDRVDVLIVEGALVHTPGVLLLGEIVIVGDVADAEVNRWVGALFDPEHPRDLRRRDDWALGPLEDIGREPGKEVRQRAEQLRSDSSFVLALVRGDTIVALVEARPQRNPAVEQLLASAHGTGLDVLVATDRPELVDDLDIEQILPREGLAEAVRDLQDDGHVICLIGARDAAALAAADCGIGVCLPGRPPPWVADLLCGSDVSDGVLLTEACAAAREVARRSVQLAALGAGVGGFFLLRRVPGATGPVLVAVNIASLAAMANGSWEGSFRGRPPTPASVSPEPWHILDPDEVLRRLDTSRRGLSAQEASRRRGPVEGRTPPWLLLLRTMIEELNTPLTPVLTVGAGLSLAVGSAADAAMIAGVVGLTGLLGGLQRQRTERAVEELSRSQTRSARVLRDGAQTRVDPDQLATGDIVLLEAGESVPADCRIIEARGLEVDEASLTGESAPVAKSSQPSPAATVAERSSMLYDGTYVVAGDATAVVVAVGSATEARRAFFVARDERTRTGVESRLDVLTSLTIPAAIFSAFGVIGSSLLRGQPLLEAARGGVSLAAAAVPEGLPLIATSAQLAAAKRLSGRGALVRDPRSIEALGRIDILCADKTGTLTEGRLRLRSVSDCWVEERLDQLAPARRRVLAAALRATPASNGDEGLPHPTDQAMIDAAREAGVDPQEGAGDWRRRDELPFKPARGYHATLGEAGDAGLLSVKGAPEVVLPRCDRRRSQSGGEEELDDVRRDELACEADRLAHRGHRVLVVAERSLPRDTETVDDDQVAALTLTGFLTINDPLRGTAVAAVNDLRRAGVEVAMITGDHPSTALGVAGELGLLDGRPAGHAGGPREDLARADTEVGDRGVITGPELDGLDDEQLEHVLETVRVFARVTPAHKVRIVQGLQRLGRVVGMTGDGANDAPAIRLAEAGIALGERATSAAREAADLVVLDDHIETIVEAIVEGRAVWSSVREAVAILLGGNLGEIAFTLGAGLLSGAPPLNPRQLLLVNLVTDVLPSMTLAMRRPVRRGPEDLVNEGPSASLGRALDRAILVRAATTTAGASAAWLMARGSGTAARASTVGLIALVFTQLGQTLVVGYPSREVIAASLGSAALVAVVVQTPGLSRLFGCRPLGPLGWATALTASAGTTGASALANKLLTGSWA